MAFIQGVAGDEFYITMQCGIEAAGQGGGVTVDTQGPEKFDPTLQKPIVDSVVATKPDAHADRAHRRRRPCRRRSRQPPTPASRSCWSTPRSTTRPSRCPQISSDNEGGGEAAFDAIKQLTPSGGKVLVISVEPGISTTDARVKGFEDAAAKRTRPSSTWACSTATTTRPKPPSWSRAALQKDPDIVGIFATNMFSAEGAATGIRQAGKQDQVKIVGFDAGPAQVKALKEGTVQALIAQQPGTIGSDGVDQAIAALDGEPVDAEDPDRVHHHHPGQRGRRRARTRSTSPAAEPIVHPGPADHPGPG